MSHDPRREDRPLLRVLAGAARCRVPAGVWCAVSVGDIILRALASDPRLGLIAAARREHLAEMAGDPIEVLRAACEQIKRSTGDRRPRSIAMHQAVYERYREWYIESIARAERLLGIGSEAQGAFPTGWPWTKRAGRMSREEKQLREDLPGWRRALADMPPSKPIEERNGGPLLFCPANEAGDSLAVLLTGDRRGGKSAIRYFDEWADTDPIKTSKDTMDSYATSPGIITAGGTSFEVKVGDSQRETQARIDALLTENRRMLDPLPFVALTNPDVPAWHPFANRSRRPTGKRAQRRAGKEWNR